MPDTDRTRVSPRCSSRLHVAQVAFGAVATVAAALGVSAAAAMAQPTITLAPPVTAGSVAKTAPLTGAAAQSVFQWQDVPMDRRVPITRAFFDQGGYQLIDDVGETIVIPFVNKNLFVMRFGHSSGDTYFVNDGSTPTLYLAEGGYLENAAAQGARWYPFPKDSQSAPSVPVFIGFAPTWDDYEADIWTPKTIVYGGYWHYHASSSDLHSLPMQGSGFTVDGHTYHDWHGYHQYAQSHLVPRRFAQNGPLPDNYQVPPRGPGFFGHPENGHEGGHDHGYDHGHSDGGHDASPPSSVALTTGTAGSVASHSFTTPSAAQAAPPTAQPARMGSAVRTPSLSPASSAALVSAPRATESSSASAKTTESKDSTQDSSKSASTSDSPKTDANSDDTSPALANPVNTSPLNVNYTTMPLPPFGFQPIFFRTTTAAASLPTATTTQAVAERSEQTAQVRTAAFRVTTPVRAPLPPAPPLDLLHPDSSATRVAESAPATSWKSSSEARAAVSSDLLSNHTPFRGGSSDGGRASHSERSHGGGGIANFGRKAFAAISSIGGGGHSHNDSSSDRGSNSRSESRSESHSESRSSSNSSSNSSRSSGSSGGGSRK